MAANEGPALGGQAVTEQDAGPVVELFAAAFFDDPTWSWAFPDPDTRLACLRAFWGLLAHTAVGYRSVFVAEGTTAATLWIPPGRPELTDDDEARVEPLLRELAGDRADDVLELLARFESHHPHDEPHYYLSLLGTHPDHRGRGLGMAFLASNLAVTDSLGLPTYLESSNRANDHRYERLGYRQIGEFAVPGGNPTLACMWRPVH
jgi:GNAT superfamily N-acetyltransferase